MDSISADPQLSSEFVKFLTAQLKESREELQKVNQENESLKCQLAAAKASGPQETEVDTLKDMETITRLEAEIAKLKEELAATRLQAEADSRDATAWRTRSNITKPETSQELSELQKRIAISKVVEIMRKELESVSSKGPIDWSTNPSAEYLKFRGFMQELAGSDERQDDSSESRVVFDLPKLQLLSKAAQNACDGGFAFFGPLLRWCEGSSHNALLFGPEYHYALNRDGGSADGSTWTAMTEWTSLVGKRHEVFDTDPAGEKLVYVGTYLFHAGPRTCTLRDLDEPYDTAMVQALASRTFTPETKSQRGKAKTYLPALGEIYKEGLATFQVLGLQRVGFNDRFFDILRKAYHKRGKTRVSGRSRSETIRSVSPSDWEPLLAQEYELGKRAREEEDGAAEEGGDGFGAGPSKLPRWDGDGWD
ncbi:hypothetical protein GY45DRAFT_1319915 [Cubamyces sp. BRFM 1775]|nr:hypothetical protein GY45DRAFT_1319915 [Cubamyces sp. BRFM 1775]